MKLYFPSYKSKLCNIKIGQWSLQGRFSRHKPAGHCERRDKAIVNNAVTAKETKKVNISLCLGLIMEILNKLAFYMVKMKT